MADAKQMTLGAPFQLNGNGAAMSFTNFTLDATTDQAEYIFQAREACNISELLIRYGVRTGTPPSYEICLQGVTSAGIPDGTVKGAGTAAVTFSPPADATWDGTMRRLALTGAYTCARGEWLAIVVRYKSGTVNASNCSSVTITGSNLSTVSVYTPYAIANNAGVRTRSAFTPVVGYKSSVGGVYLLPIEAVNAVAYSVDSTPDEYALAFNLSWSIALAFRVVGVRARFTASAAAKTVLVSLYDGTTTLQSIAWDSDINGGAGTPSRVAEIMFDEATLETLVAGHTYRVAFAPQDTAANMTVQTIQFDEAGDRSCVRGGDQFWLSTRTDSGAWTDDTTQRPLIELILENVYTPSAGGLLEIYGVDPMAVNPTFIASGILPASLSTVSTNYAGGGTYDTLVTGGANGTEVRGLRIFATAETPSIDCNIILFHVTGGTKRLIGVVRVPAKQYVNNAEFPWSTYWRPSGDQPIRIASGDTIQGAVTAGATTFHVLADGGHY